MTSTDPPHREPGVDLVLRPAGPEDLAAVSQVFRRALTGLAEPRTQERWTQEPPTEEPSTQERWMLEEQAALAERVASGDLWVAVSEADGASTVRGFADLEDRWLRSLYVDPDHAGTGVGSALLELAKALRPGGFGLWVAADNQAARDFYRRRGLLQLEHVDDAAGARAGHQQQGPARIRMAWPGADPMAFLRGEIDEVDDDLAALLARRLALTAAIQRFKPVAGHHGRDADREAQIMARMARRAPDVPEHAWRRLVQTVVTVGLDLAAPTSPRESDRSG